ncbi:UNVERIFIED_CONTAM: hypothetical protein K2H54_070168 [Gekko kuhli]
MREPVLVEKRVAVCVWWMANIMSYRTIGQQFGLACSTVARIVAEVMRAITQDLLRRIVYLRNPDRHSSDQLLRTPSALPVILSPSATTHNPWMAVVPWLLNPHRHLRPRAPTGSHEWQPRVRRDGQSPLLLRGHLDLLMTATMGPRSMAAWTLPLDGVLQDPLRTGTVVVSSAQGSPGQEDSGADVVCHDWQLTMVLQRTEELRRLLNEMHLDDALRNQHQEEWDRRQGRLGQAPLPYPVHRRTLEEEEIEEKWDSGEDGSSKAETEGGSKEEEEAEGPHQAIPPDTEGRAGRGWAEGEEESE